MFFDRTFLILIPALIIAGYAQLKVSSTFEKFNNISSINGYTGAQVARMLLDDSGLYDVNVEIVAGKLTDHYDPKERIIRLSETVFYGTSVASNSVAAHETGHAIQHKESYSPLAIRRAIQPIVNFSSNLSWILFIVGMLIRFGPLLDAGILLFLTVILFQLITLPVEFNASSRALKIIERKSILTRNELAGAKTVLDAAALTYVAAVLTSLTQLVRLILIRNNRD